MVFIPADLRLEWSVLFVVDARTSGRKAGKSVWKVWWWPGVSGGRWISGRGGGRLGSGVEREGGRDRIRLCRGMGG